MIKREDLKVNTVIRTNTGARYKVIAIKNYSESCNTKVYDLKLVGNEDLIEERLQEYNKFIKKNPYIKHESFDDSLLIKDIDFQWFIERKAKII